MTVEERRTAVALGRRHADNRKEINHRCNPCVRVYIETRLSVCTIIGIWIMLSSVTTSVARAQAHTCATCASVVQIARWRDCRCYCLLCIQCKIIIARVRGTDASARWPLVANSTFWNFIRVHVHVRGGSKFHYENQNRRLTLKFQINNNSITV